MKTILNINGSSFLLHPKADAAALIEALRGMTQIHSRSEYGPEGARYEAQFCFNREVVDDNPARFGVELIADAALCSSEQWAELVAAKEKAAAEWHASHPQAAKSATGS